MLDPFHLISCIAAIMILYVCNWRIKFFSAPTLYKLLKFHVAYQSGYLFRASELYMFSGVGVSTLRPTPNLEDQVMWFWGFRPLDQLPSLWLQSLVRPSLTWGVSSASSAVGIAPLPPLEPLDILFWAAPSSGFYPLACPARVTLMVVTLPPA